MRTSAQIEGILFAVGDPVKTQDLAEALGISTEEAEQAVQELARDCRDRERGIQVVSIGDGWQLCAHPDCSEALVRLTSRPAKQTLTGVQRETLAIIAYRQPVTKAEIAKIRGVNSDHAVNKLIEYGLVCEVGRMEAPGRPILLGTTEEFLRRFGLSSTEDLPELPAETLAGMEEESAQEPEQTE